MSTDTLHQQSHRGNLTALCLASSIAFMSGLFIMTLELVAARLVAQNLGVSLYTWTSVIGVILAGVAIGNFIGGKLADLYTARTLLPALLLLASAFSLSVLIVVDGMGAWARPDRLGWPLWILWNVALTFLLPSWVLGTIAPVAAKIALSRRVDIGATVGTIYAWGTAGSITGTFLTGFVLINLFGTRAIVCGIATGLALMALLLGLWSRRAPAVFLTAWLSLVLGISALAVGPWEHTRTWGTFLLLRPNLSYLDYFDESNYFTIEIYDSSERENSKVLALDNLVHSYVSLDDPTRLEYAYETIYAAVTERLVSDGDPFRAFFIGGGGYTLPRYLEEVYSPAAIDVAEIDPAVKAAANAALGLPNDSDTLIRTHAVDARNFIDDQLSQRNLPRPAYDLIYGDAFNDLSVPYHLTTLEFNEKIAALLSPDGAYMANVIDIYDERLGRFLGAFVATARLTFENVYVVSADIEGPTSERETFVVIGSQRRLPVLDLGARPGDLEFEGMLFAWAEGASFGGDMSTLLSRARGIILTDNYVPVDNLVAPLFLALDRD